MWLRVLLLVWLLVLGASHAGPEARATPDIRNPPVAKIKPKKRVTTTTRVRSTTTLPPTRSISVPTGSLTEASGCAITRNDPNTVWLHNDSGNDPELFALDLRTGTVRSVRVANATLTDWEDMAPLPTGGVLIGDIGDNNRSRRNVTFYRVADLAQDPVVAEAQTLIFEDGPHDAEALLVDPDPSLRPAAVYVITKEATGRAAVYQSDGDVLRKVAALTLSGEVLIFPNQITGADALPDGSGIIVRTYQFAYLFRRPKGQPFAAAFNASPLRISVPFLPQSEAVCVVPDGRTAITTTESRGSATIAFVFFAIP